MPQNNFQQRKQDVLGKDDKSSKGNWDKKIADLCERINSFDEYYTTSSCAGRVVIMIDEDKKGPELFLKVYHDLISIDDVKSVLLNVGGKIKFKQEPCILHVVCNSLESAQNLYDRATLVGWKRSGLISWGKNIVLELNSTEKLEFPLFEDGNILVNDDFLEKIVEKSNENLEKNWEKIEKLKNSLE